MTATENGGTRLPLPDPKDAPCRPAPTTEKAGMQTRWIFVGLGALVVCGVGLLLWAWMPGDEKQEAASVPLLQADAEPVKVRPENPGGLQVADLDKLVYRRIGDDRPLPVLERLLPEPEEPQPLPQRDPAPPHETATAPTAPLPPPASDSDPVAEEMSKSEPAAEEGADQEPAAEDTADQEPAAEGTAEQEPSTEEASKSEVASEDAATSERSDDSGVAEARALLGMTSVVYHIQVASVRTAEQAEAEWKRMRGRNTDLLGGLMHDVSQVDLGERGVWFRVRVGPVAGKEEARSLCSALKARKINCIVVQPSG